MWPEVQNIIHDLLWEILLRVVILAIVCVIQLKVTPRTFHISETDLLSYYKCPRCDSYVPSWVVVIIVVFVPLLCFYVVFTMTKNYVDIIQAMLSWSLAMSVTAMITESLKLLVGRPRPDYFYRCFPDGKLKSGLICTGNIQDVIEGRKSFPSGHSSFTFCSLGFLSLWLCGKLSRQRRQSHRVLTLSCFTPLIMAAIVALSRHYDHHHHWEDILVGTIIGLASSYFCYLQYYYPLHSEYAGIPLTTMTEYELFRSYHMECCTRSFDDDFCRILQINSKNSLRSDIGGQISTYQVK